MNHGAVGVAVLLVLALGSAHAFPASNIGVDLHDRPAPVVPPATLFPLAANSSSGQQSVLVVQPFTFIVTAPRSTNGLDLTEAIVRISGHMFAWPVRSGAHEEVGALTESEIRREIQTQKELGTCDGCEVYSIVYDASTHSAASGAVHRATKVGRVRPDSLPVLRALHVQVGNTSVPLDDNMDESYTLSVEISDDKRASTAQLSAATYWGALRGLESFSQLIRRDPLTRSYTLLNAPWFVVDAPVYRFRGMLMDLARHFQPLSELTALVDALAAVKLNVLHLHIEDQESFPFASEAFPLANVNAAYSRIESYTLDDFAYLVEYARQRGVRVIGELDTPGHADSWCDGYPSVCPAPDCTNPLNPASKDTLPMIRGLIDELSSPAAGVLTDPYFHVGGDEVRFDCWNTTEIQKWMQSQGYSNFNEVYGYFVNQSTSHVASLGRTSIVWEDVYLTLGAGALNPDTTIIELWQDEGDAGEIIRNGFRVIVSSFNFWYIGANDKNFTEVYTSVNPLAGVSRELSAGVLGGSGAVWTNVLDKSDMDITIWPNAAAIAEVLWSGYDAAPVEDAVSRAETLRCATLHPRGIGAGYVTAPHSGMLPPYQPGTCFM